MKEKTSCLLRVQGLLAAAGKRQGSDARRRSYCCWYCSLVLVLLWSVVTRTQTQPSSGNRGIHRGTHQATPAVTFYPLTEISRLQQTNATSQIIHRGYTAPPALCSGPPSAASIAQCPSCASGLVLSRERHSPRRHTSHVSTAARSRRLPHQSPSPILKQSLSNSNLIGLTLMFVKAVIDPSLSKMSLRIGAVQNRLQLL